MTLCRCTPGDGRLRAECLNENWFLSLDDARSKVESWRRHYNGERPHSALGNLASSELPLNLVQDRVQAHLDEWEQMKAMEEAAETEGTLFEEDEEDEEEDSSEAEPPIVETIGEEEPAPPPGGRRRRPLRASTARLGPRDET